MSCIYRIIADTHSVLAGEWDQSIDNEIVAVNGEWEAHTTSLRVQEDLKNAGFVISIEKSTWVPSTKDYLLPDLALKST